MPPASEAQKRATKAHRARRRRIELLLDPESAEAKALARLAAIHGGVAGAIRYALLACEAPSDPAKPAKRAAKPTPPAEVQGDGAGLQKPTLSLPIGPVSRTPGSMLKGKR